jgi:hypothetical protein
MSHTSMILTGLMMMALLVFVAPNIFALNRGHILRNIALWLAIFFGLSLIYQNFGPDSPHPLFQLPDAMKGMTQPAAPQTATPPTATPKAAPPKAAAPKSAPPKEDDKDSDADDAGNDKDFTPPSE